MNKFVLLVITIAIAETLTAQSGNVGVGTSTPKARLDVWGIGTTSSSNTFTLRNSLGDTLLKMKDDGKMGIGYNGASFGRTLNIGGSGINFYTANEVSFGGAIFPTDTSLIMWSNSGQDKFIVLQPVNGNVGIGTYSPNAKLQVEGAVIVSNSSIDTLTPGSILTVRGNADVRDTITCSRFKFTKAPFNNYILKSDNLGNATWGPEVSPSNSVDVVPRWTGSGLVAGSITDDGTNLSIGSGGTLPGYKLIVRGGNLRVDGDISIASIHDYTYSSPRYHNYNIPAAAFQLTPLAGTSTAGISFEVSDNFNGGLYVVNGTPGTDAVFDAPIYLPDSAVITAITLYVRDFNTSYEVYGQLIETDGFAQTVIATTPSTGVAANPGNTEINHNAGFLQTSTARSYSLRFNTKENATGLRIFSARLTYYVTKVE